MTALHLATAMALLAACGGEAGRGERAAGDDTAPSGRQTSAPAGASGADAAACPATGRWALCSIVERLERSGLVPLADSAGATEPPLTPRGMLLRIGRAELEVYLYADTDAREREQRLLARDRYVDYAADQTFRAEATLIGNANLIAILHSNNSKQRERVGDALTAGPPQPKDP